MATVTQGWFVDPVGRFDGRLFDGDVWTDQVSQDGKLLTDPDWITRVPDGVVDVAASCTVEETTADTDADTASAEETSLPSDDPPTAQSAVVVEHERRSGSDRRQVNIEVKHDRRRGDRRSPKPSADEQ